MKLFRKIKKGFTLVELVVVIAVIAILAAVSVGAYFGVTESAKASKLEQESKQLYTAIHIVGNSNSDNHQLDANGLHIVDTDVFEVELNKVTGGHYEVYKDGETQIAGDAIILKEAASTNDLIGNAKTYSSFEYYTPETGKKAGVIDVISGEYSTATNNNITISNLLTTAEEVNKAVEKASSVKANPTLIKLGASIIFEDNLLIVNNKAIILDLNGYTITAKQVNGVEDANGNHHDDLYCIRALNGANVVITGNGRMQFSSDTKGAMALVAAYEGSEITIENGWFNATEAGATLLYSKGTGVINVKGGDFDPVGPYVGEGEYEGYTDWFTFNKRCTADPCDPTQADNPNYGGYSAHECELKHFVVTGGTFYRNAYRLLNYDHGCTHNIVDLEHYEIIEGKAMIGNEEVDTWTVVEKA